jgi:mRNA interferase MazF
LFWVNLPDRGGREQRGRRPALIWQDTDAFSRLPTVLIIPLTSQLETLRFGGTLRIEPSQENGLTSPSVVLVFQLGACDTRRFGPKIGRLDEADLKKVKELAWKLQKLG